MEVDDDSSWETPSEKPFNVDDEIKDFLDNRLKIQKKLKPDVSCPQGVLIGELHDDLFWAIRVRAVDLKEKYRDDFIRRTCRLCCYELVKTGVNEYEYADRFKPMVNEKLADLLAQTIILQIEQDMKITEIETRANDEISSLRDETGDKLAAIAAEIEALRRQRGNESGIAD